MWDATSLWSQKTLRNCNAKNNLIFQYWSGMILGEIGLGGVRQAYIFLLISVLF
jgi:hypothetical protein